MNGIVDIAAAIAVVALVVGRQFQARRVKEDRKVWLLPLILGALALRDPHLIDPKHQAASVALLIAGVLVEIAMGSVWGWTVRLWRESDGSVWAKGTMATVGAWAGMIVVRGGLYALGRTLGVHQGSNDLMLALAALLLVRGAVVAWRARNLETSYGVPAVG